MYRYADRAIRAINRKVIRLFDKLRVLKFDELNIISTVSYVYDESVRYSEKKYLDMAILAYEAAFAAAHGKRSRKNRIDRDWLLDYLEEYDPVTLYRFLPETDRKKERTAEAIIATGKPTAGSRRAGGKTPAGNRKAEIDKALRYWSGQLAQYAINITDKATLQAYKDAGVKYVMWNTEKDEKVCVYCHELDGKVFPITNAPGKQHFRCRCYYTPVSNP